MYAILSTTQLVLGDRNESDKIGTAGSTRCFDGGMREYQRKQGNRC